MDDEFVFSEEPDAAQAESLSKWKILVVDDDDGVHQATRITLQNVMISGRKLQLFDVSSGSAAVEFLKKIQDIDLVLLDMVMERHDAGLEVAHWLREVAGRHDTPIIVLRTGQPGLLNDDVLLKNKYFNEVMEKSRITRSSMIEVLTRLLPA